MARLHRRNFLPSFILNLVLWISTILIVVFLDPEKIVNFTFYIVHFNLHPNVALFFLSLTLSLTLTFALLFANTRRGLFLATFVTLALFLRLEKLGYWYNLLFLFIILLSLEIYISKRKNGMSKF